MDSEEDTRYLLFTTRITLHGNRMARINTKSFVSMSGRNARKQKSTKKESRTIEASNTWKYEQESEYVVHKI